MSTHDHDFSIDEEAAARWIPSPRSGAQPPCLKQAHCRMRFSTALTSRASLRREGHHSDLQRRRRAHAGLYGPRVVDKITPRHFRSSGSDRARQGTEHRTGNADYTGFEALVFKASRGSKIFTN